MPKRSFSSSKKSSFGNGGIAGSGVFGNIGLGTMIHCDASDSSLYCSFMKVINVIMLVFIILLVLYVISIFVRPMFSKGRR
jgi:hypothetical protein